MSWKAKLFKRCNFRRKKAPAPGVDRLEGWSCGWCGAAGAVLPTISNARAGEVAIGLNAGPNPAEDPRTGGPGAIAAAWEATSEWEAEREDMLETCQSVGGVQVDNPYPWNWVGGGGGFHVLSNVVFGCMEQPAVCGGPNAENAVDGADSTVPVQ